MVVYDFEKYAKQSYMDSARKILTEMENQVNKAMIHGVKSVSDKFRENKEQFALKENFYISLEGIPFPPEIINEYDRVLMNYQNLVDSRKNMFEIVPRSDF